MKSKHLLCCDWGTSNFRLYLTDFSANEVIAMVKSDRGIALTFDAWKENKSNHRISFYRKFLASQVKRLATIIKSDLAGIPIILSGMASSSIGMKEIPYTNVPFSIEKPNLHMQHFPKNSTYQNELLLYGGLKTANDVMRGEEVQLLGLSHLMNETNCVCLLPGTHSKHIWIKNKIVFDFQTFMTGEFFQLIRTKSILKGSVDSTKTFGKTQQSFFEQGVLIAQTTNLLNSLFSVRTNTLLKDVSNQDNYYYLSGLLIGQELKALENFQGQLLLNCETHLAQFYQLALTILQLDKHLQLITGIDMEQCIPIAHQKLYQAQL